MLKLEMDPVDCLTSSQRSPPLVDRNIPPSRPSDVAANIVWSVPKLGDIANAHTDMVRSFANVDRRPSPWLIDSQVSPRSVDRNKPPPIVPAKMVESMSKSGERARLLIVPPSGTSSECHQPTAGNGVDVGVGNDVDVGVSVGMGVCVAMFVGIAVTVGTGVGDGAMVAVEVGVIEGAAVREGVGTTVAVGNCVAEDMSVGVGANVGKALAVASTAASIIA